MKQLSIFTSGEFQFYFKTWLSVLKEKLSMAHLKIIDDINHPLQRAFIMFTICHP